MRKVEAPLEKVNISSNPIRSFCNLLFPNFLDKGTGNRAVSLS